MVSVIIPSYNHGRYLRQCLDSVVAQTFEDWELIVVDDSSSDDSVAIARSYSDRRISVHVNEVNLGTYGNLNRGIHLAQGEIVAILNSDDFWHPTKLQRQMELWAKHPEASLCYCRGHIVDDEGRVKPMDHHHDWPHAELQDVLPHTLHLNRVLASSLLFRRGSVRFDDTLRYSGDWVALINLARQGLAALADEPLTSWRIHGAQTSQEHAPALLEHISIRREILENPGAWKTPHSDPKAIRKGLTACALMLHASYLLVGEQRSASAAARIVDRLDPGNRSLMKRRAAMLLPRSVLLRRLWPTWDPAPFQEAYRRAQPAPLPSQRTGEAPLRA